MSAEDAAPKVMWEMDSTDPHEAVKLREALREVRDPELGLNIIELGLVREVAKREGELEVRMILTTPFCPYGPAMLEMSRAKAEEAAGLPTRIELGPEAWEPGMMEEGVADDWGLF